jgi:hypothetical protein
MRDEPSAVDGGGVVDASCENDPPTSRRDPWFDLQGGAATASSSPAGSVGSGDNTLSGADSVVSAAVSTAVALAKRETEAKTRAQIDSSLVWVNGGRDNRAVVSLGRLPIVLGRSTHRFMAVTVSREHCVVDLDEGGLHLRDLRSENGTFLNGQRIGAAPLHDGDLLTLGSMLFVCVAAGGDVDAARERYAVAPHRDRSDLLSRDRLDSELKRMRGAVSFVMFSARCNAARPPGVADAAMQIATEVALEAVGSRGFVFHYYDERFVMTLPHWCAVASPEYTSDLRNRITHRVGRALGCECAVRITSLSGVLAPGLDPTHVLNRLEQRHRALPFRSAFISYGSPDEKFALALRAGLLQHGILTWCFATSATPGQHLYQTMYDGIASSERVLLVCSERSLHRAGVLHELRQTLGREVSEGTSELLIPICLDRYLFDAWQPEEAGLRAQVANRVTVDFSQWREPAGLDAAISRLLGRC